MILGVEASRAAGDRTGVGHHVMHLLRAWAGQELPFQGVRVFSSEALEDFPEDERFELEVVPANDVGLLWQATRLRAAVKGVDVLFGHYSLPPGYRGRAVVYNLGTYRGRWAIPGWRAQLRARHFRWSARRADVVIANSRSTKADVVHYYGVDPERVVVIWPGAATDFRPSRPGDEEDTARTVAAVLGEPGVPYFLFVGKLSKRRNVPALIEAFADVHRRNPSYHLLIVGPNTSNVPIGALVECLGLDGSVVHVPFLDHAALGPLYRGARAFVLPTEHEGFSGTIPEALASGCPVITVEHAALADAGVRDAVLVVPEPSPALLAGALQRIVDDDELRRQLAHDGLEAAKFLSWDETGRRVMDVLARVAGA